MSSSDYTPRRGLPRWLKVSIVTLLVLANLAVLGIFWIVRIGDNALAEADTDDQVTDVLDAATGDLTFLLVGSDTREGLDDLKNFGSAGGERGDVIMLVKFKRDGQAQMLSIPRDLWVDIPGQGKNKINAAYAFGGPSLMVQTIKQNLGVEINHYVEINFVGFMAMIDDLGGIEIAFPNPARDLSSGLDVDAGMQRLDGKTALAYARSRKYQELQGGQWVGVDASDIGRTQRQQEVIRAILTEIKSPSTITEAGSAASSLARHTTVDSRLASSSVAQLAWDFRAIVGGDIEGVTLPVVVGTEGNASVVYRDDPAAQTVIDNFKAGRPFADQPTRIQVLNGNGVAGAAGDMARRLELEGFDVVDLGDAPQRYDTTTILAHQGTTFGNEVRSALGFGEVVASDVDNRYDVVVIVGSDAA